MSGEQPVELPPSFQLVRRGTVTSTNDEARALAHDGAPDGTLIRADHQTGGRGRAGRTWTSAGGNLYASLLVSPPPHGAAQTALVAGVAAADSVTEMLGTNAPVQLKWPNDVVLNGRKLAGMLAEWVPGGGQVALGIGVNVGHAPAEDAIALNDAGAGATASTALAAFAAAFEGWWRTWLDAGFGPVRTAWLARAHPVGATLRVRLPGETLHGTFQGLGADGTLLLDTSDGVTRRIGAGDVDLAA